ncbi:glycosyltransferase family 39 protein [bacterium]|nr:glycosyltransferase family 39 protein [bacterium]
MKNNTFFKLFLLCIIAFLIRAWFLDKPEGLWNDEYMGWYIASMDNIKDMISHILTNCHTPLYYFYLKFWMFLFGDTDYSLRMSSVFPSILCIPTMFLLAKKMFNEECGYIAAIFTTFSSFCIYFAQEARLYSLLFLICSILIYTFYIATTERKKIHLILYFVLNAILCLSHTIGIIFSIFNIAGFIYSYNCEKIDFKQKIKELIKYILPFIFFIIIISPLLFNIAFSKSLSQFWSEFSYSKIFYTFIDYFSPIQTNLSNSPVEIIPYIYNNSKINFIFIIFGIIPFVIGIITIINSIKQKNKVLNTLLVSSLCFFSSLVFFSFIGKIVLATKYSVEMYPVLILAFSYGIYTITNKKMKYVLLSTYFILNLLFIFTSPEAPQRLTRPEGNLAPVELIRNSRLKPGENVILTYYDLDKFKRYLTDKDNYKFTSIDKFNFNEVMFKNDNYYDVIHNGKMMYRDYFRDYPAPTIQEYSFNNFITKMRKDERIGILFLDNVSFISNESIQEIISDDKRYMKTPFIFLCFSALRINLMYSFKYVFEMDSITQAGDWTLVVYKKKN